MWYLYTMKHYSAIKRNEFKSVVVRWMNLEPTIQSEVNQKEKNKYHILSLMTDLHVIQKKSTQYCKLIFFQLKNK